MFRRCLDLHKKYEVEGWYGDAMNEPMMNLMVQSGAVIPLAPAPYIDDPNASSLYRQIIRELTREDKKVLWYGESSLPGHVRNLPEDKPINISEYPPVAALGYVAAALYLWLQLEYKKKPKTYFERIIKHVEDEDGGGEDEDGGGYFPE